jgi:hypothetical protein
MRVRFPSPALLIPGLVPVRAEVRSAQASALGSNEDDASGTRLGEPFEVPAQFRHQLGGETPPCAAQLVTSVSRGAGHPCLARPGW